MWVNVSVWHVALQQTGDLSRVFPCLCKLCWDRFHPSMMLNKNKQGQRMNGWEKHWSVLCRHLLQTTCSYSLYQARCPFDVVLFDNISHYNTAARLCQLFGHCHENTFHKNIKHFVRRDSYYQWVPIRMRTDSAALNGLFSHLHQSPLKCRSSQLKAVLRNISNLSWSSADLCGDLRTVHNINWSSTCFVLPYKNFSTVSVSVNG